jgi:2-methylcitrate dehydratase PrpD
MALAAYKSQELASFVYNLRYRDLPDDVVAKVKEIVLHTMGVELAASTVPWTKQAYHFIQSQGGTQQSTVVNYGHKTTAINTTFINSTFAHGFEMDDNHHVSSVKSGCVTVPTGLAIGEQQLSTGAELITAIAAGYEIMVRVGLMITPESLLQGAHPTGSVGAFGAAAVTGKLMGLSREQLAYALAGSGAQRAGLSEIPPSGRGHLKRIFGAMAAVSGIRMALLVREGLTTPLTTLDPGYGFPRTFGVSDRGGALTDGLGERWELLNVHYKIYAQDGYIQPVSEALKAIRDRHDFATEDIASVWLGTNQQAHDDIIGTIRDPQDVTDAQFSANYSAALYLVTGGAGFTEYTDDNLHNPAVRELAERVTVEVDAEIEAEFQRTRPRGAKVAVTLKDGTVYREMVSQLRLLTPEDLDKKYRTLSQMVLSPERSEALLRRVHDLEEVGNVAALAPMLCARA